MPNVKDTLNNEVEQLRKQINELKHLLSIVEEEAYSPSNIRKIVESELTSSGMYKLGRFVVFTFLILGVIFWCGGTIYSGIQIKSVEQRAKQSISELNTKAELVATELETRAKAAKEKLDNFDESIDALNNKLEKIENNKLSEVNTAKSEILTEISNIKITVATAASEAQIAFGEKKEVVSIQARNAIDAINSLKDFSLTNIKQKSITSLDIITQEQERAKELLNVASLPDLGEIKTEIASLEKAGGELNLANIHKLAHWSWWVFVISTILLTLFGIFFFVRRKKSV